MSDVIPQSVRRAAHLVADAMMGVDPRVHGVGIGLVHGAPGVVIHAEYPHPGLVDDARAIAGPDVLVRVEATGRAFAEGGSDE